MSWPHPSDSAEYRGESVARHLAGICRTKPLSPSRAAPTCNPHSARCPGGRRNSVMPISITKTRIPTREAKSYRYTRVKRRSQLSAYQLWRCRALDGHFESDVREADQCWAFPRAGAKDGHRLGDVVAGTVGFYLKQAAGRSTTPGLEQTLSEARAREAQARADAIELRNNISRGHYVSILAVRKRWEMLGTARRETMLSFAGRIAGEVHGMQSREAAHEVIDNAMRELLEILSGGGDVVDENVGGRQEVAQPDLRGRA